MIEVSRRRFLGLAGAGMVLPFVGRFLDPPAVPRAQKLPDSRGDGGGLSDRRCRAAGDWSRPWGSCGRRARRWRRRGTRSRRSASRPGRWRNTCRSGRARGPWKSSREMDASQRSPRSASLSLGPVITADEHVPGFARLGGGARSAHQGRQFLRPSGVAGARRPSIRAAIRRGSDRGDRPGGSGGRGELPVRRRGVRTLRNPVFPLWMVLGARRPSASGWSRRSCWTTSSPRSPARPRREARWPRVWRRHWERSNGQPSRSGAKQDGGSSASTPRRPRVWTPASGGSSSD